MLKGKLDERTKGAVLIGYPEGIKGYKLWNSEEDKIVLSRDVIFEEDNFPMNSENRNVNMECEEVSFFTEEEEKGETTDTFLEGEKQNGIQYEEEGKCTNEIFLEPNEFEEEQRYFPLNLFEYPEDNLYDEDRTLLPINDEDRVRRSLRQAESRDFKLKCNKMTRSDILDSSNPKSVDEALLSPEAKQWEAAMMEEMENLRKNETWELVQKPPGVNVISAKWVFKRKSSKNGEPERFRARLVARGFTQVAGVDYKETFSPVVKTKTIRILMALCVEMGWKTHQYDVVAAYLNGTLKEEVYLEQPKHFVDPNRPTYICLLKKTIYGLHQSGREWNEVIDKFLKSLGFKQSMAEPCLYYHKNIIVIVYVDDLLGVAKDNKVLSAFGKRLAEEYEIRDLGEVSTLLSINIEVVNEELITLDQTQYIEDILENFGAKDIKVANTPLDPGMRADPDIKTKGMESQSSSFEYRQIIGSLIYLAGGTRPDLAFTTAFLSQFNENPSKIHWAGVRHLLRYLQKTKYYKLVYQRSGKEMEIFSDADWGSNQLDRKSFNGYVVLMAGAAVSWSCKKQTTTALSTTEAEFMAMCHAGKEALWISHLLMEIGMKDFVEPPISVQVDNQGAIHLVNNKITSERNKHIALRYFFLRDLVENEKLIFKYVKSSDNPADILTKVLGRIKQDVHVRKIGLMTLDECLRIQQGRV